MLTRSLKFNLSRTFPLSIDGGSILLFQITKSLDLNCIFSFSHLTFNEGGNPVGSGFKIHTDSGRLSDYIHYYYLDLRDLHFPSCNCFLTVLPISPHFPPTDYSQDQLYRHCYLLTVFLFSISLASLIAPSYTLKVT